MRKMILASCQALLCDFFWFATALQAFDGIALGSIHTDSNFYYRYDTRKEDSAHSNVVSCLN